ncbi:MAG: FtsQ-type POTRA domain-containing protein [Chlamydiae bacterium]|nr:FtsQ-type POTRA domain-containing protein [Chlamydiota bacterium]
MTAWLHKQLPLRVALLWIVASTFLITGSGYSLFKKFLNPLTITVSKDDRILEILQTGPQRDRLTVDQLAEILGLAQDIPTSLQSFDLKKAEEALLTLPVLKEVHVEKLFPHTLYIDYTMREPVAFVYDYENMAIDEAGYVFPFSPFYSPKMFPEIYFGKTLAKEIEQGKPLQGKELDLALHLVELLQPITMQEPLFLKRVDVSQAFHKSFGRQEIVIEITHEALAFPLTASQKFLHYLRLSPQSYNQQLGNYFVLHKELMLGAPSKQVPIRVIDLRMEGMAFIQEN